MTGIHGATAHETVKILIGGDDDVKPQDTKSYKTRYYYIQFFFTTRKRVRNI